MAAYDLPDDPFDTSGDRDRLGSPVVCPMVRIGGRSSSVAVPIDNIALDIALHPETLADVATAWGVGLRALRQVIKENKALGVAINAYKTELEKGGPIRVKARSLLEGLLPKLERSILDPLTAQRDKNKSFQLLAELADALPRPTADSGLTGNVFNFTFANLESAAKKAPPVLYDGAAGPTSPAIDLGPSEYANADSE